MRILFLKAHTFLEREMIHALSQNRDIELKVIELPEHLPVESAHEVYEQLRPYLPAILFSINNAGFDDNGILADCIVRNGSHIVNWFTDHPFYEEIRYGRTRPNPINRIDLVSESAFVEPMHAAGMNAHFMPLATDPEYFAKTERVPLVRDIAFVGNSSLEFMDSLITDEISTALEQHGALILELTRKYKDNPSFSITNWLVSNRTAWHITGSISPDLFIFAAEWMVGYFYRRDFIVDISKHYKNRFTCFGDGYWSRFVTESPVSTEACYYDNLATIYASTCINLNINRIQIPTSFTQRIFDCAAAGGFCLSEKRALNNTFFETSGNAIELVDFASFAECKSHIDFYSTHENERTEIILRAQKKVLAQHTYAIRVQQIITICKDQWGI